jgi:hypothetical protein
MGSLWKLFLDHYRLMRQHDASLSWKQAQKVAAEQAKKCLGDQVQLYGGLKEDVWEKTSGLWNIPGQ